MKCPNCGYETDTTFIQINTGLAICDNCGVAFDDEITKNFKSKGIE